MKKYLPFVFPLTATVIVLLLAFRWYAERTQRSGEITPTAEGVQIENLSETELKNVIKGVGDVKSVDMEAQTTETVGDIRYEIVDGKVKLSVTANLPALTDGQYQVWLQAAGQQPSKAFILELGKAGFIGSAAISADELPVDVIVSKEVRPDNEIEQVLLKGTIAQEIK